MLNIIALLLCLFPEMSMTTIRQFSRIALALLAMTGRVTMLGISRWTGQGGSYRTMQRFFATTLPWAALFWLFFRKQEYRRFELLRVLLDVAVFAVASARFFGSSIPPSGHALLLTHTIITVSNRIHYTYLVLNDRPMPRGVFARFFFWREERATA